jgi:hypothetical protein
VTSESWRDARFRVPNNLGADGADALQLRRFLRVKNDSRCFKNERMTITRNIGMLLLAIYLILVGIIALAGGIAIPPLLTGVLALIAGIFILIGR